MGNDLSCGCFACRHFYTNRRFVEECFITEGLRDWKKLAKKLTKHAGSQSHLTHMQKWLAFKSADSKGSVTMQISEAHKAEVIRNRKYVAINPQLLSSEMELFASMDTEVDINFIQKELTEDSYPQYYKMVQLALTLPVGSATAERSFSAMRRIRNWLRSTMGQERFSSLALLNIESDLTGALVPEDIVLTYATTGNRRLLLY